MTALILCMSLVGFATLVLATLHGGSDDPCEDCDIEECNPDRCKKKGA